MADGFDLAFAFVCSTMSCLWYPSDKDGISMKCDDLSDKTHLHSMLMLVLCMYATFHNNIIAKHREKEREKTKLLKRFDVIS